ncbi:MAG: transglutaminase family protein [Acidimicrobiales bacterium]|nr:transglutaminase family protein [Acidimicrobiales bacterium]
MGIDPAYLAPGYFVDSEHPAIAAWAAEVISSAAATSDTDKAIALYDRVRDDIRYDPYAVATHRDDFKASQILTRDRNWCIPKAVLLCAGSRAVGVPCRLGFADVRNHLASEKLTEQMGTDLFVFHGFVEFHLAPDAAAAPRWVKATPAFNLELCTRFGVKPLEFDGRHDSIYHPFDVEGRRHMEYVNHRGIYADLPFDEIDRTFGEVYGPATALLAPSDEAAEARGALHDEAFHGPE